MPAAALLVTEYLGGRREQESKISFRLALAHSVLCALLIFAALSTASVALTHHLSFGAGTHVAAAISVVFAIGMAGALAMRAGPQLLRSITMLAAIVGVAAVIRLAAPAIDATQSSRATAQAIQEFSHEPVPVALYHVGRTRQYGLDFYLNQATQTYETGEVPSQAHLLVAAANASAEFGTLIPGRKVSYLTSLPAQKLELYWIGEK